MAREATITQEQVNAAADGIRAGGAKPTARAIRDHLGTGSMATVLKLFQVWQAGQVKAAETPITLPASLQRALVDFIGQEISTAKADLQAELVNLQQANGDLIAESERQASTIELQAEALESVQSEKAEVAGRLAQVESDFARAVDDVAGERQAAEAARTELAKAQLRLEAVPRIEADLERLRKELDAERQARTAAEQNAAVAGAKLEGMTQRANKADEAVEKVENVLTAVTGELSDARAQVRTHKASLESATRECEDLRRQIEGARAEAKKSGEEAAELRGKLAAAAEKKPGKTTT